MTSSDLIFTSDFSQVTSRLERLRNLRTKELLEDLGEKMLSQVQERIDTTHEGPDGTKWDEWSDSYARSKSPKIDLLHASGDLMDDLSSAVGRDSVTVGSDLVYALVHQEGDEERGIPARPYLGISRDDLEELGQETLDWIGGLLR